MEAALVIKLLSGALLAWSVVYVLLLRPWRPVRLIRNVVPSIDLLFFTGVVVAVIALHNPLPFRTGAELVIGQTELRETLADVDQRITSVEQLPERTWQRLMSRLGWIVEDAPEAGPAPDAPGRLTTAVLPAVEGLVEVLLRAIALWGAVIVLAICQVMRLVVGLRRWQRDRARRKEPLSLDARVMALEEALVTLQTTALLERPSSEPAEA